MSWTAEGLPKLVDHVGRWQDAGPTHLSVNTMGAALTTVEGHLEVLASVAEAVRPFTIAS